MRLTIASVLIFLFTPNTARGEDLTPPPWRGDDNTTFQHWWFPPANFGGPAPDAVDNPYGAPAMSGSASDWRPVYRGALGVWRLSGSDALIFDIPNTPDGAEKDIWT